MTIKILKILFSLMAENDSYILTDLISNSEVNFRSKK